MTEKNSKSKKLKEKNTSNGENWKGVMKYRTTGAKLGEKNILPREQQKTNRLESPATLKYKIVR